MFHGWFNNINICKINLCFCSIRHHVCVGRESTSQIQLIFFLKSIEKTKSDKKTRQDCGLNKHLYYRIFIYLFFIFQGSESYTTESKHLFYCKLYFMIKSFLHVRYSGKSSFVFNYQSISIFNSNNLTTKENKTFLQKRKTIFSYQYESFCMSVLLSLVQAFQCLTFDKNLSGYNFSLCLKRKFPFLLF